MDGPTLGTSLGAILGDADESMVGAMVGSPGLENVYMGDGSSLGTSAGMQDDDRITEGGADGSSDGQTLGTSVGAVEGPAVGIVLGTSLGDDDDGITEGGADGSSD